MSLSLQQSPSSLHWSSHQQPPDDCSPHDAWQLPGITAPDSSPRVSSVAVSSSSATQPPANTTAATQDNLEDRLDMRSPLYTHGSATGSRRRGNDPCRNGKDISQVVHNAGLIARAATPARRRAAPLLSNVGPHQ